jgi:hypothetical protein
MLTPNCDCRIAICDLRLAATSNRKLQIANRKYLSLPLLMLGVAANHAYDALAPDDLAILTNPSDACSYLHDTSPRAPAGAPGEFGFVAEK